MTKNKKTYFAPRKGNSFLEEQKQKTAVLMAIAMDCGSQRILDMLICVLHDPEVMGKDTFGRKRIDRVVDAINLRDQHYAKAYGSGPEADYFQEKLDGELREVYGDETVPFRERNPAIEIPGYEKAHKNWK